MTKTKPKAVKPASQFPSELYVVADSSGEDTYFVAAASETELLTPGDKAVVGVYRLVEACEMSAEVIISRKPAKK